MTLTRAAYSLASLLAREWSLAIEVETLARFRNDSPSGFRGQHHRKRPWVVLLLLICVVVQIICIYLSYYWPGTFRRHFVFTQGSYLGAEWLFITLTSLVLEPREFGTWVVGQAREQAGQLGVPRRPRPGRAPVRVEALRILQQHTAATRRTSSSPPVRPAPPLQGSMAARAA